MSISEEETVESEKKFYVIGLETGEYVDGETAAYDGDGYYYTFAQRVGEAKRFDSVTDAVKCIAGHSMRGNLGERIVRVTEVPGKTEVKLVSKTKIDATKPVVGFYVARNSYAKKFGAELNVVSDLQDATVFPDLGEFLIAQELNAADIGKGFYSEVTHVHQVELVTTSPTFTEEVVA